MALNSGSDYVVSNGRMIIWFGKDVEICDHSLFKALFWHWLFGYELHDKGILGTVLFLPQTIQTSLIFSISLVVNWLILEADHLFQSVAKVKKACSCTSISRHVFIWNDTSLSTGTSVSSWWLPGNEEEQDRHCLYNVTLRRLHVTVSAMEKQ